MDSTAVRNPSTCSTPSLHISPQLAYTSSAHDLHKSKPAKTPLYLPASTDPLSPHSDLIATHVPPKTASQASHPQTSSSHDTTKTRARTAPYNAFSDIHEYKAPNNRPFSASTLLFPTNKSITSRASWISRMADTIPSDKHFQSGSYRKYTDDYAPNPSLLATIVSGSTSNTDTAISRSSTNHFHQNVPSSDDWRIFEAPKNPKNSSSLTASDPNVDFWYRLYRAHTSESFPAGTNSIRRV